MSALDLIGRVGAMFLSRRIEGASTEDGIARFMLDRLTGPQVAAIVKALLGDAAASGKFTIRVPTELVAGEEIPETVLTDERSVGLRHAAWPTPALLLANTEDDQGTSLQDVTRLGAKHLTSETELWVAAASQGLGLPNKHIGVWCTALSGLIAAEEWSLQQMAGFVDLAARAMRDEGRPLLDALGFALSALQLPRDSGYFRSLGERDQGSRAKWRKQFERLVADRAPLLVKQRRPGQIIESDELKAQWEAVRNDVLPEAHAAVEAFIASPPGWGPEADGLAHREFEEEGVSQLFSGLKQRKLGLAEETIEFFEDHLPTRLDDSEKAYLDQLKRVREASDEERDFFETHREDLSQDRGLRAKWEKFVFGKAIETRDLLSGLLLALERLYGQSTMTSGPRTLEIRSSRQTRAQWLDLNADVGLAFATRYKGLPQLMGESVRWDAPYLFDYPSLLEHAARRKKYRRNESTARASLQIKFDVTLRVAQGASVERNTVQLIWSGHPQAIGNELAADLERLEQRPLMMGSVGRQFVSRKGALQSVSLADVTTLDPAFGRDCGSLVPRLTAGEDLARRFPGALKESVVANRVTQAGAETIKAAFTAFATSYGEAISAWREHGICSDAFLQQASQYGALLTAVRAEAASDVARRELLQPLLQIGCIRVVGGPAAAIIAPWHPMRMMAISVKARMVGGLFRHVLTAEEANFGDRRLFFADLGNELVHPWYPEVAVGYQGVEPLLLAESDTLNDYTLMERPVADEGETVTDVDASEAARQIRQLVGRYLDLQPHEAANLSIMLFNCDAAGLPLAAVTALGAVSDGSEVHCNVLVRHRDREKLARVYGELLERADGDADALVVSEASKNFMSKLRIGVMLDDGVGETAETQCVDVAFLHDVVARHARLEWFAVPTGTGEADVLEHVPARWSYRRVTAEDELKATSFLACPRQPAAGWAHLDAVAAVVRQRQEAAGVRMLPARQISFEDQNLKAMFDEVHSTAEWVATYDELLDKRQLKAQGVRVIRYRRQRTHGRNMIVSSTADMRILDVLVRKRLNELSLGLADDRIAALAARMINEALLVSGDIVLRAAKRGVSAGELIGVVLSRALLAEELGATGPVAWFLLDDYAEWLGQREEGIADILGLAVLPAVDCRFRLRLAVSEAKYVAADGCAAARRTSERQLRETILRMDNALFGDPGRLDRDLWLSRIADLLLDGNTPVGRSEMLEAVRDAIRRGDVEIDLRGYSHVFVANPADGGGIAGDQESIGELSVGLQEVFGRAEVRALVHAYEANLPLAPVRAGLGDARSWETVAYRVPADRVRWIVGTEATETTAAPARPAEPRPTAPAAPATAEPVSVAPRPDVPVPHPVAALIETLPERRDLSMWVALRATQQHAVTAAAEAWLKATEQKLRSALLSYHLQAKITGSRLTPNAALIRFLGSDRLRVEDIEARRSALLTTHGLRIVAISPMPGEIVISVERPDRQIVSLWDLWARRDLNVNAVGHNTSFVLGLRELDGEILYLNLGSAFGGEGAHEPHTLIAGATGSGKSVLIQALILDIAATNSSRLVEIHLIDPKLGVDYAALERLPHVRGGIIVEQTRAIEVIEGLVDEMERRYQLFRGQGARDLKTYNQKAQVADRLPMVFVVHDEFAEWMLTENYRDAVTASVQRLGVKARAAGIHLFFAAQRPDANVMPVQLRDNLGNRLVLKVASVGTSEIALGVKGAEGLLGLGHLAARLQGQIIFAQAPFLSDDDIELVVDAIRTNDGEAN